MTTRTKIILEGEDRTAAAIRSARSNLQGLGSAASTANRLLAGLGVGLSAGALTAFISKGVNAAAALGDLSTRTGVAVRDLAGLQLVAKQSDTSIEALGKSVNKLGVFMAENSGAAQKLGLTAKEPLEAFIQLSGVLTGITDVQLRNAIANKVLGRSYEEMLPALLQGPEALRRQIEQGQRYNRITQEMADEAKKFTDQLDLLGVAVTSVSANVAGPLVSAINNLIEKFREARKEGFGILESLKIGLKGGELQTIEDELAALGRSKTQLEKIFDRPFVSERAKEETRKKLGEIENEIRIKTARMELLMHEQFRFKAPAVAAKLPAALNVRVGEDEAAAERRAKAAADFVARLREQAAVLGMSKEQIELYKAAQMGLSATQMEAARAYLAQIAAYDEGVAHMKSVIEAEEEAAKVVSRLRLEEEALTRSLKDQAENIKEQLDPQYDMNKALALYNEQLNKNKITQEEYNVLFDDSIKRMVDKTHNATGEMSEFAKQAARNMQDAFADFLFNPFDKGLKGMVAGFLDSLRRMTAEAAAARIFESMGGNNLVSSFFGLFNAKGNAFNSSGVMAFARGGVVNSPTLFPFANGVGLMGEAGPEAIMPLRRGPDGRLGVASSGGGGINVIVNVDANGSSVQGGGKNAAELGRMIGGAVRDVLVQEKRPGGLLS